MLTPSQPFACFKGLPRSQVHNSPCRVSSEVSDMVAFDQTPYVRVSDSRRTVEVPCQLLFRTRARTVHFGCDRTLTFVCDTATALNGINAFLWTGALLPHIARYRSTVTPGRAFNSSFTLTEDSDRLLGQARH